MRFLLQCVFHVTILRHELRHSSYQISYWRVRDASFVGLDFRAAKSSNQVFFGTSIGCNK